MEFMTLTEIAKRAKQNLSKNHWDYLVGGADTESALKRNRYGVDAWVFKPRVLNDVSHVDASTQFLGQTMRMPVLMPPIGSIQVFEPGGAESVAKAVEAFGILQIVSSVCTPDFETLAANVPGASKIYQLYQMGDQDWMDGFIRRCEASRYVGFCLTVDTQVYSRRERDIIKRHVPGSGRQVGVNDFTHQAKITWATLEHIKANFSIPLVVKGILRGDDAARAAELGVDVIYVSNHGGRQLDHTQACIDALPDVVSAVAGRAPVVVDGGFLRGADVVKAMCLGASAVGTGRLQALAMAAGGEAVVLRMLEILEHEIRTTMALAGVKNWQECTPDLLERTVPISPPHVLSAFPLLDEGY